MLHFGEGLEEKLESIENTVHNVIEDMVRALETGAQVRVDGRQGRRTVALLESIYASAHKGTTVECK